MKVIGILVLILIFIGSAFGQETFTITGSVSFQYDSDIYIRVCTMEEWAEFLRPNYELSVPPWILIKMNDTIKKAGKVSFKLDDVAIGTYVVVAFQDVIQNQIVDYEGLHMKEPWGTFREDYYVDSRPRWDNIKFKLEKNLGGIKIRL